MKWEGQQESDNVEDRRRIGKKGLAIGGGAGLLLLLIGAILGFDPQKLKQLVGNLPGNAGNDQAEQRPLTAQDLPRSHFLR
jgi:predicted metalloprotease